MTQPLAVLNDEEMHWLNDLGLPNQRRWLNHRNSVTNTAERFPPPPRIVAHLATKRHLRPQKRSSHKKAHKSQKMKTDLPRSHPTMPICFLCFMCLFVARSFFVAYPRLSLPAPPCSLSRLVRTFNRRSSISAHSALRAASCESACSCMFLRRCSSSAM
jgi:hypothetical protein